MLGQRGFNPRAHTGRDDFGMYREITQEVSIHAPTRGAMSFVAPASLNICFNPRAHTGRDINIYTKESMLGVSIHAPTRGAMLKLIRYMCNCEVSIHAPTRGAMCYMEIYGHYGRFNPRAHTGRDFWQVNNWQSLCVSIHAPTRGAII